MGQGFSCPDGFQEGGFLSCNAKCIQQFKNAGTLCVHGKTGRSFQLMNLPRIPPNNKIPTIFAEETRRVEGESAKIQGEIDATEVLLRERDSQVQQYSKIQTDYAMFRETKQVAEELRGIKDSLRPLRVPTAPSSDLEKERRAITDDAKRSLYFIQFVLFLIVLVLLAYALIPIEYANPISFLLLCGGISLGFFLKG